MYEEATRRKFLRRAFSLGAGVVLGPTVLRAQDEPTKKVSANESLNLGIIGVAARGAANLEAVSRETFVNIVALCDIDRKRLAEAQKRFPRAQAYEDFRHLLDRRELDAVVVSTPDHMHAIPVVRAMEAGFDVYCEKPLAHSVHEVRVMRETATKHGRVTQMGTQIHAEDNYRRVVEIVKSGALGAVRAVHVWQDNRPLSGVRVRESTPPKHVNYDLWLGPAPYRPYHESSFHFNWRYWWDFGGGVLADIGCHYMDLPHWALGLEAPVSIGANGSKDYEGDNEVPGKMRVDYTYPGQGDQPPVHLTWYHGWLKAPGVLFEGEKGLLFADYRRRQLFLGTGPDPDPEVEPWIPSSIGHHREWLEAVKTRGPTTCNFEYSGALAEAVLLGNVAYRAKETLEWDTKAGQVTNTSKAEPFLRREYRKGWTL
jgi:predicted dehydrogenase